MSRYYFLYIFLGLFVLVCTISKPAIYWENYKMESFRNMVGDRFAQAFLFIWAFALFLAAFFAP